MLGRGKEDRIEEGREERDREREREGARAKSRSHTLQSPRKRGSGNFTYIELCTL